MNGVHDLGGTDGLGPVVREQDEPVWHADWEKVCFALFPINAAKGFFGVDEFRFGIEQMHPAEYLLSPYYEHWLHTVEHYAVKAGAVDREELERRTRYYLENPDAPVPEKADPELAERMASLARSGAPARRDSDRPARFSVGDRVRVKDDSPFGHTRRARYIRGRTGVIEAAHGTFIYPDSAGNGRGDDPQHVYTVVFRATDLWGEHGDPNSTVRFDVWEPYLEQA